MGYIHSLETFGTVDGPGVRFVVFFQGCPMRCQYCHNPDTWNPKDGQQMEAGEIIARFLRNASFYKTGGITATGGEPMLQIDFLTELFTLAKQHGIHTCLDTSGVMFPGEEETDGAGPRKRLKKIDAMLDVTDLVMLDIKHIDPQKHRELTEQPNEGILAFAQYLNEKHVDMWIRHVVVPGITDDDRYLFDLGYFIGQFANLKALDVLPYHTMGEAKYKKLDIPYKLAGVPAMDKNKVIEKKEVILNGIRKRRAEGSVH